jgi:drug/metabolite transporter (DMT)-like permease
MPMVLLRFWLRRFTIVFAIACTALALLEWLRHGDNPSYLSALGWAGAAGLVAASIATYWAYKHGCAIPRQIP